MDWFVKAFVKASVVWLAVGIVLGMAMAVVPAWTVYRAVHVHVMLLGFVTMFINGVAYHVVPRLSGRPLWSVRAAHWHFWIANAGLCVMVAGFWLRASGLPFDTLVLSTGGTITGIGALLFVLQVFRTVDAPNPARARTPLVTLQSSPRRDG
jgi:cbb3-type cytochrome oxidase subunit 1